MEVLIASVVDGASDFDASAFDFSEREACLMDPQFRVFLEVVLTAAPFAAA